jgi:putative membrane protein
MIQNASLPAASRPDRTFFLVNGVVSAAALAFLGWLLVVRSPAPGGADLSFMPAVNAALNATSATCLTLAYLAIRKKNVAQHRMLVTTAFVASALFLVGYIVYHYAHGDTHYPETGVRPVYLIVLASHVLLSVPVVPLCLTAFYFALTRQFDRHKKVAKITLPIWLYVSVTGVVVFAMLRAAGAG